MFIEAFRWQLNELRFYEPSGSQNRDFHRTAIDTDTYTCRAWIFRDKTAEHEIRIKPGWNLDEFENFS